MSINSKRHARERAGHHATMSAISLNWLDENEDQITEAAYHSNATAALAHATLAGILLNATALDDSDFEEFSEGSA